MLYTMEHEVLNISGACLSTCTTQAEKTEEDLEPNSLIALCFVSLLVLLRGTIQLLHIQP